MALVQTTLTFAKRKELTTEQHDIATHRYQLGARVLINAYAGTGKTTTCRAVIQKNADKRILYTVFNKAMQSSAAEFAGDRVKVCTTHSLALAFCKSLAPRARYSAWTLPDDCDELYGMWRGETVELSEQADALWDEITEGIVPYPTHQAYYHVFCREPRRTAEWLDAAYDLILVDEAQDCDAGLVQVLEQVQKPLLLVGDTHQDLYGFRGTINALEVLRNDQAACYQLTQSFRFGPAVAQLANRVLGVDRIVGLGQTAVQHGTLEQALSQGPSTLLCRSNMAVVQWARQLHVPIHIVGSVFEQVNKLRAATPAALERRRANAQREGDEQLLACIDLLLRIDRAELEQLQHRCVPPSRARCILSTVHSAKGLEWDRVVLDGGIASDPQLYYVAVTRAKKQLFL